MPGSTRFAVAIHTLAAMAVGDGRPLRSEDLAFSASTNPAVIRGLLSRLHEAKLTTSRLGAGGGAVLARPAGEIRLLDVYRAVEDTELFAFHRETPCQECLVGAHIQDAMRPTMERAQRALEAELAGTTIADIAVELARLGDFSLPLRW